MVTLVVVGVAFVDVGACPLVMKQSKPGPTGTLVPAKRVYTRVMAGRCVFTLVNVNAMIRSKVISRTGLAGTEKGPDCIGATPSITACSGRCALVCHSVLKSTSRCVNWLF